MNATHKKKLAIGFASQVAGRLAGMAISIVSIGILARLLPVSDFGLMAVALAVASLADAIFDGAFGLNIINRKELDSEYVGTALKVSLVLASILTLIIFIAAPVIENVVGFPGLSPIVQALSFTLVIKAAGMISRNMLVREHRLVGLSVATISGAFGGSIVVSCGLAYLGFGVWSLVWGSIASVSIETVMNLRQARPPLTGRISVSAAKEILSTGSLYSVSQVLNWGMNSGASIVAARWLGPIDLGFYSRGTKLLELTTAAIGQPMMRVFLPTFARMKDDSLAAQSVLIRALSSSSFVFGIASILLAVHSEMIVRILLGSQWGQTATVAQILFLSLLPRCNYKITESAAFGLGAASLAVKRQAIFAAVSLVSVGVGVHWGMVGAALGAGLGIWLNYFVSLKIAADLVKISFINLLQPSMLPLLLSLGFGAVDLAVIDAISPMGFFISEVTGAVITVGLIGTLLIFAPSRFFPPDIVDIRNKMLTKWKGFGSNPAVTAQHISSWPSANTIVIGGKYMNRTRVTEVDGLRGLAIFLVLVYHYLTRWAPQSGEGLYPYGNMFANWPIAKDGSVGVYLFFIVSGFVIYQSLERSKSMWDFVVKRADRLVLPMVVVSSLTFILLAAPLPTPFFEVRMVDFLPSWTFTAPMFWKWLDPNVGYIDGVYWTLFIEVRFYVLMAIIWFIVRSEASSLILTILAFVGIFTHIGTKYADLSWALKIVDLLTFPQYISFFAAGTVYNQVLRYGASPIRVALLTVLVPLTYLGLHIDGESINTTKLCAVALFHLMFIAIALRWPVAKVLSFSPLVKLGAISYSLYLVHQRLGVAILHRLPEGWPIWLYLVCIAAVTAAMIAVAYLSWKLIEEKKPFSRLFQPRVQSAANTES